jgi:hypothetical protein
MGMNAKVLWTGGNRGQTYDTLVYPPQKVYDKRFEEQYKPYFRVDVNLSYRVNRPRTSHILSLDIQNVTNRINTLRKDWDYGLAGWKEDPQFGIFPFVSYKIEF